MTYEINLWKKLGKVQTRITKAMIIFLPTPDKATKKKKFTF